MDPAELLVAGAAALRRSDLPRAFDLLTEALRRDPSDKLAATKLAELQIERWDHVGAIRMLTTVLQQEPNFAPALAALAQAHWLAGRPAEGLAHARRAVAIQPPNPHFRLVLAQLCIWLDEFDEAFAQLMAVLDHPMHDAPIRARAFSLLGDWHVAQGRFAAADAPFRDALMLAADSAGIHGAYGMNLLRQGRFAEGWPHYEWNREVPFFRQGERPAMMSAFAEGRHWSGECLRGKTILLWDDQGFGDAIQFFRYLALLPGLKPARVVHCTLPALVPLFAAAAPFAEVVTQPPPGLAADFHCRTSSLPVGFRTRLDTIPAAIPYLAPPRGPPARRRAGLQVGLVWSGDPRHLCDHHRSIRAAQFLELADLPGIGFHSLLTSVRPADLAALAARPTVSRTGEAWRDFADAAATFAGLDLVITVDTAAAHLAGALGRPVWVLLPRAPDWRWLAGRDDSPWYPTARLFRADARGWPPVLQSVRVALEALRD